jgi:tetratricopeptide (TPR) repeat protein
LALADGLLGDLAKAGNDASVSRVAVLKALLLLDTLGSAGSVPAEALEAAHRTDLPELLAPAQTVAALQCWATGQPTQAQDLLRHLQDYEPTILASSVQNAVRCAVGVGDIELARQLVSAVESTPSPIPANAHALLTARALLAHGDGDDGAAISLFTEAADRWERFGNRLEHAHALLGLATSLRADGHDEEAGERLHEALDLFTTMGADHRVRQCRELLAHGPESGPRTA